MGQLGKKPTVSSHSAWQLQGCQAPLVPRPSGSPTVFDRQLGQLFSDSQSQLTRRHNPQVLPACQWQWSLSCCLGGFATPSKLKTGRCLRLRGQKRSPTTEITGIKELFMVDSKPHCACLLRVYFAPCPHKHNSYIHTS